MGIHDGHGGRQFLIRLVMIGHDHIHAKLGGQGHFPVRCGPAVRGDEERNPLVMQPLDRFRIQSVAFPFSMGDVGPHIGAERSKEREVHSRRRHPVDVIITIKTDRLMRHHCPMQSVNRLLHVGNQKGVVRELV
jgi:hypothetical protein